MKQIFILMVLTAVCCVGNTICAAVPPNIVFVLADDLGYGDLSCYGQEKFKTPNIDNLAAEGMKFTQFYAGSTVCAPSRCTILTGYHTGHSFIRGNKQDPDNKGDYPIPADTVTVAKLLKQAGYTNGCFGKWGLGMPGTTGSPVRQGFDEFFGYYGQGAAHRYYPPFLHRNEKKIPLDGQTYSHDLIEKEALQFIRNNKEHPFFCYVTTTIPHAAMQVPEEYVQPWRSVFPEFEDTIGKYSFNTEVRNPVAAFPAMVTRLDDTVGRIVALLKELNIDENTIVIFSSDNGPHHEGGHRSDLFHSSGVLKGYKRDLYEGGIRTPFIVRWTKHIAPGSESDHIGAFWDILPTFAALTGSTDVKVPDGIDGISFLPTLLGKPAEQKQHDSLYWEFHEQKGKIAARWGKWKGVRLNVTGHWNATDAPVEVYDLESDAGEKQNVAAENPEIVKKFREIFARSHTDSDLFKF